MMTLIIKNQERGIASTSTQIDDRLSPANITVLQGDRDHMIISSSHHLDHQGDTIFLLQIKNPNLIVAITYHRPTNKHTHTFIPQSIASSTSHHHNRLLRRDCYACLQDLQPW